MRQSADVRVPDDIAEWVFVEPVENDTGVRLFVDTHHRGDARLQSWVTTVKGQRPVREIAFVSLSELVKLRNVARQASQSVVGLTADDLRDVSANQEQVLRLFSLAAELGSSDIHMSIAGYTRIEMRINGDLQVIKDIPREDGYALASTIILSMCDVTEKQFFPNRKQDGRVKAEFLRKVNLFGARYSHTPTVDGLYLVMRTIADDGDNVPTLPALGYLPAQCDVVDNILRRPEGMVILSGPTGSGKSTTLRVLSALFIGRTGGKKRLLTVEDPPEGRIPGSIQTPIIADKADPEATALAWVLSISSGVRLDPDAMLLGEIRDLNSAIAAVHAALTGHRLFSTTHANCPISILERLVVMGLNPALIADAQLMIGLLSQRLVPTLCPHCSLSWATRATSLDAGDRDRLTVLFTAEERTALRFHNPAGCSQCCKTVYGTPFGQGIAGRTVIAEVIQPDARFMQIFREQGKAAARQYWVTTLRGITRNQHLLIRIREGRVDPLLAEQVCPLDEDRMTLNATANETGERHG